MPSFLPSFLPFKLSRTTCAAAAVVGLTLSQAPLAQVVNGPGPGYGRGTWETTLHGRDLDGDVVNGYEAYYDNVLNITWLAEANYAYTSGYDDDGYMTWDAAQTWAAQLNINGIMGWRLPELKPVNFGSFNYSHSPAGDTDNGYNITSRQSELANLYHVTLGNTSEVDTEGNFLQDRYFGFQNYGPFSVAYSDLPPLVYWSGLEYGLDSDYAWSFAVVNGAQGRSSKDSDWGVSAWAVHPGDVGAVPEPQGLVLVLIGVGTTMLVVWRSSANVVRPRVAL